MRIIGSNTTLLPLLPYRQVMVVVSWIKMVCMDLNNVLWLIRMTHTSHCGSRFLAPLNRRFPLNSNPVVTNTGDEDDGYDETLIPVDFQQMGQIRDDDLLRILVKPLPEGCNMTCLFDACHSGTVLDLRYRFTADGDKMVRNSSMDFDKIMGVAEGAVLAGCCLFYLLSCLIDF